MAREPDTKWVAPENPTEGEIAEARRALENPARHLAQISARACHELGIRFDMDDPQVAREAMKMTIEALFHSRPQPQLKARKSDMAAGRRGRRDMAEPRR